MPMHAETYEVQRAIQHARTCEAICDAARDRWVADQTEHLLELEATDENVAAHRAAVAEARRQWDAGEAHRG